MRLTEVFEQETTDNEVGYPASEVIDRIRATDRSRLAIYHGLQAMSFEGIGPRTQGQIIEPYAEEISAYLDEMLSTHLRNTSVIAQGLRLLSIGARWPELRAVLEKNKDEILWYILTRVKDSVEKNTYEGRLVAKTVIQSLKDIGIDWPEFDMIMKSLDAPEKVAESEEDNSQLEFAKHAIPSLFKKNNPGAALNIINALYKADPDNVEWLKQNITPVLLKHYNKKKILQWVVKSVEAVTMPRIVSAHNLLKELGVELPDIKTIIDDHKEHVIKRLLQVVQNHKSIEPVIQDVQQLRQLGIAWPELDVIERSSLADKKLSEDTDVEPRPSGIYRLAKQEFEKGKTVSGLSMLNLFSKSEFSKPSAADNVDMFKNQIMKLLLTKFKDEDYYAVEYYVKVLQKAGVNWPEFDIIQKSLQADKKLIEDAEYFIPQAEAAFEKAATLDAAWGLTREGLITLSHYVSTGGDKTRAQECANKYKNQIVKFLLVQFKSEHYVLLKACFTHLRRIGLDWSELETIKQALQNQKYTVDEQNLSNHDDELAANNEWQIQHILDEIDIQLGNRYTSWINWVYQLRPFDAMPRLKPLVLKHKKNVLAWAMNQIKVGRIFVLSELQHLLTEADVHIPELDTIVEDNKDTIVKFCLVKMKQGNRDGVESVVKSLRKAGIDWPELDIIERSITADKKPIRETIKVTQDNSGYLLRELITAIEDRELKDAVDIFDAFSGYWLMNQVLSYIVMHSPNKEDMKWFFDSQKTPIMRHILEEMREDSTSGYVDQTLKYLSRAGVDWPELAAVKKSLAADKAINNSRNIED